MADKTKHTPMRNIRVSDAEWQALADAAAAIGISRSQFIREASLAAARLPTLFVRLSANNVVSGSPDAVTGERRSRGDSTHRKPKS
jgi:hypothetical protein